MSFGAESFGLGIFGGSIGAVTPTEPGENFCVSIVDTTDNFNVSSNKGESVSDFTDNFSISTCLE